MDKLKVANIINSKNEGLKIPWTVYSTCFSEQKRRRRKKIERKNISITNNVLQYIKIQPLNRNSRADKLTSMRKLTYSKNFIRCQLLKHHFYLKASQYREKTGCKMWRRQVHLKFKCGNFQFDLNNDFF